VSAITVGNPFDVLQFMPVGAKHRLGRLLAGPYRWWNIEVAMRYLPIVRIVQRAGLSKDVIEIGSGGVGIAPYLGRPVVGVDQEFGEWRAPLMTHVFGSALELPFRDGSCGCVVSVDMLEHLPADVRDQAIDELVRVTSTMLVIAVPSGWRASDQDRTLDERYLRAHGERYRFLTEHLENGLPNRADLEESIQRALTRHHRSAHITYRWNTNLVTRSLLMRLWIRDSTATRGALMAANYLHHILSRANFGRCYRLIVSLHFSSEVAA
jgi:hypothetical protein